LPALPVPQLSQSPEAALPALLVLQLSHSDTSLLLLELEVEGVPHQLSGAERSP
jgi:hypothetical protein